jgi:hypothetical protein
LPPSSLFFLRYRLFSRLQQPRPSTFHKALMIIGGSTFMVLWLFIRAVTRIPLLFLVLLVCGPLDPFIWSWITASPLSTRSRRCHDGFRPATRSPGRGSSRAGTWPGNQRRPVICRDHCSLYLLEYATVSVLSSIELLPNHQRFSTTVPCHQSMDTAAIRCLA